MGRLEDRNYILNYILENDLHDARKELKDATRERDTYEVDVDSEQIVEEFEAMLDVTGEGWRNLPESQVMKEVDPTMYREELNNYADGYYKYQIPEYQELCEEVERLENEVACLEEELKELEGQDDDE